MRFFVGRCAAMPLLLLLSSSSHRSNVPLAAHFPALRFTRSARSYVWPTPASLAPRRFTPSSLRPSFDSHVHNYSLDGQERGVNYIDYYCGVIAENDSKDNDGDGIKNWVVVAAVPA